MHLEANHCILAAVVCFNTMEGQASWEYMQLLHPDNTLAYLGFPLVSDEQVVGGEISVHHTVAVHKLHCSSCLVRQLQPGLPLMIQPEAWGRLQAQ